MEITDTDALRSAAPDWTLAGDKQLLDLLQNIHQSLMTRCQDVNQRLDEMVTSLDGASVDLQNVNNKFMALSNSQFIESRVYDDDADVAVQQPTKETPKASEPPSELDSMRESVRILEDMHEAIQILDSDSDTDIDDDATRTILKPKNVYHRPLPHIIGSRAWRRKWHAGLVDTDSDSKSDSDSAAHTDSKSDTDSCKREYSDDEPEMMGQMPDSVQEFQSPGSYIQSEAPARPSPADVAADLARRLRGATPPMTEPEPEYAVPKPTKVYRGDQPTSTIFSDEPPPLDQYESEEEDDIFAELHKSSTYPHSHKEQSSLAGDLFSGLGASRTEKGLDDINEKPTPKPANQVSTLFSDESEPELFAQPVTKPGTSDSKAEETVKKPIGGISLFGSNKGAESIGAAILKRNQRKTSSDEDIEEPQPPIKDTKSTEKDIFEDLFAKTAKPNKSVSKINKEVAKHKEITKKVEEKRIDLFSDDLFDNIDDIFTTKPKVSTEVKVAKKVEKSIFDDDDDLFADVTITKSKEVQVEKPKSNLFDSDDELFSDKKPIFTYTEPKKESKPIEPNISKPGEKVTNSIFDDASDSEIFTKLRETKITNSNEDSIKPTPNNNKESKTENIVKKESVLPHIDTIKLNTSSDTVSKNKTKTLSLFDDDESEDIFSSVKKKHDNEIVNTSKESTAKIVDTKISKELSKTSLFDDNDNEDSIFGTSCSLISKNSKTENSNKIPIENEKVIKNDETNKIFDNIGSDDIDDTKEVINNSKDTYFVEDIPPPFDTKEDISEKNEYSIDEVHNTLGIAYDNSDMDDDIDEELPPSLYVSKKDTGENYKDSDVNTEIEDSIPEIESIEAKPDSLFVDSEEATFKSDVNVSVERLKPQVPDFDVTPSDSNKDNKSNDSLFSSPSVFETDNIFSDILDEPPVFEKSKEPKKSKNINALFDDDSDDEALFFKKNDVILDEKPDFNTDSNDALFGIFHNEPPAIDVDFIQKPSKSDEDIPDFIPDLNSNTRKENIPNRTNYDNFIDKLNRNDIPKTDDNDLFNINNTNESKSNVLLQSNSDILKTSKPDDIFSSDSDDLFRAKPKIDLKQKEKIDAKPPKPDTKSKTADSVKESDTPDSPKKIGKLKSMNLNINVNTLLPGASPKKKIIEQTDGPVSTKSQENLPTAVKIEPVMVKSVSFEGEPDSQILDNKISKERAKIQVKRRPSTRRARKEAVRKSAIDIGDDSTDNSSSFDEIPKPKKCERKDNNDHVTHKEKLTQEQPRKIDLKDSVENVDTSQEILTQENTEYVKDFADINDKQHNAINDYVPENNNIENEIDIIENTNLKENKIESQYNNKPYTEKATIDSVDSKKTTNLKEEIEPELFKPKEDNTNESLNKNNESNVRSKVVYILNDEDIFNTKPETEPKKSLILSDDNDEDLFKNASSNDNPIKTLGNAYKDSIKPKTESKKSIFDDLSDDENELFNTNKKTVAITKPKGILDSDSEEDLFGGKKETKDKVASVKETKQVKAKVEVKGSLFGDDDDDDLFGAKVKSDTVGPSQQTKPVREVPKPTELVFDDPLSLLGGDDE